MPHVRRLDARGLGENLPSPLFVKEGNPAHLNRCHQWRSSWQALRFSPHTPPNLHLIQNTFAFRLTLVDFHFFLVALPFSHPLRASGPLSDSL